MKNAKPFGSVTLTIVLLSLVLPGSIIASNTARKAQSGGSSPGEIFIPQPAAGPQNRYLRPIYEGPFQIFQPSDNRANDGTKPSEWPQEGYQDIRAPAMIQAQNGNLVAVADGRLYDAPDRDAGSVDLLSRVSEDGGRTWSETRIISTEASPVAPDKRETHAHQAMVTAPNGDIILVYAVARYGTKRQSQVQLRRSKDHGNSWSEPVDIGYLIPFEDETDKGWSESFLVHDNWNYKEEGRWPDSRMDGSVLRPGDYVIRAEEIPGGRYEFDGRDWRKNIEWFSWGPGNGIVHSDGSLIFTVAVNRRAAVMRSTDNGYSWTVGPRTQHTLFENDPVELSNGDIMTIGRSFHYMTRAASSPYFFPEADPDMEHWFYDREGKPFTSGDREVIFRGPNLKRVVIFSPDGSQIKEVYDHTSLIEPISNSSVLLLSRSPDPHIVAFGNPVPSEAHMRFSNHIGFMARDRNRAPWTIRLSFDDGKTWPISRVIPHAQNQSKLVDLGGGEFGVITEHASDHRGHGVQFVRFSIGWLMKFDPLDPGAPSAAVGKPVAVAPSREVVNKVPFRSGPPAALNFSHGTEAKLLFDEPIFSDREHRVFQLPEGFEGMRFVRAPISGTRVTVSEPGMLYVLNPSLNPRANQQARLLEQGFEAVDLVGVPLFLLEVGGVVDPRGRPEQSVWVFQKEVALGEVIEVGQWAVFVF